MTIGTLVSCCGNSRDKMAQQFGHKSLKTFMMAHGEGLLSSPLKKEVAVGSEVQSSANVASDNGEPQDLCTPFESVVLRHLLAAVRKPFVTIICMNFLRCHLPLMYFSNHVLYFHVPVFSSTTKWKQKVRMSCVVLCDKHKIQSCVHWISVQLLGPNRHWCVKAHSLLPAAVMFNWNPILSDN